VQEGLPVTTSVFDSIREERDKTVRLKVTERVEKINEEMSLMDKRYDDIR
jgi:hypothetical protein